jgi:hypothetical protein
MWKFILRVGVLKHGVRLTGNYDDVGFPPCSKSKRELGELYVHTMGNSFFRKSVHLDPKGSFA